MITVDTGSSTITIDGRRHPCRIGRSGAVAAEAKQEGDGCTPLGRWPIRGAILRPDRGFVRPPAIPWRWCRQSDGWCDDPSDGAYNRAVIMPYRGSAERLWRNDDAYDSVLVLGYNDAPPVPYRGSAIFLHIETGNATEGCVAVDRNAMTEILAYAQLTTAVMIS
jgi:L,D-peptidoglycan transpeptidase YkuD (ErfK/YbiS/YcfS/YnhG family)